MTDLRLAVVMRLVDRVTGPLRRVSGQVDDAGNDLVRREERRAQRLKVIGGAALGVGAAVLAGSALAVRKAIQFEEAFAEVKKVTSIEDETEIAKLQAEIQDLSTQIPIAQDKIAEIVAAASQANVVDRMLPEAQQREQVLDFAESVGKIAVAFETSNEAASDFYIGLVNRAGLSLTEAQSVADAVNHLSNNTSAAAGDLMGMMVRIGGIGSMAGLTQTEIAALSASFRGAAPSAEIAATAMKNFLEPLTAGESSTDRQAEALERLGLTAVQVAEDMQVDAKGTIVEVMERLGELSDVERPQVLRDLVGAEALGAVSNLVANVEKIPEAFALIADEAAFAGSATQEFEARMGTTAAQVEKLWNNFDVITTRLGEKLLPILNDVLVGILSITEDVRAWAAEAGNVKKAVVLIGVAIAALGALALLNPVIAGLTGIGAVALKIIAHWDQLKASLGAVFDWIVEKAKAIGQAIKDAFTFELPDWISGAGTGGGQARADQRAASRNGGRPAQGLPAPSPGRGGSRPGRALGGNVSAGSIYEWQEEGTELFAPLVDGRVISNTALRGLSQSAGSGGGNTTIGDIHVHAAPGMSARDVAMAVRAEMEKLARPRSQLHDGAIYG